MTIDMVFVFSEIGACLLEWGIERVCAITIDNASGNDVAIDYVKNQMLVEEC